jgi:hypothetical protein
MAWQRSFSFAQPQSCERTRLTRYPFSYQPKLEIRQVDPLPFFVPTETGNSAGQGPPEPVWRA